ncbi:hypothetical protein F3Y22_tig00111388pilonHSYRG00167 [Hibiscus syriacus]|uniref:RNase H type-1 domain-containing protein n=1 Tax=Hibiscus syriacus TaxID=106335 RepID=A0A6A2YMB0_HIBSY|nr:hypothetical protein F3Y22_tig00111388pilonHSYRG00167 [Hibiscus syriacus]
MFGTMFLHKRHFRFSLLLSFMIGFCKTSTQPQPGSLPRQQALISWTPPPFQWITLNTDGALCSGTMIATIGGLLRDSSGHWLGGFNRTIGFSNALQA